MAKGKNNGKKNKNANLKAAYQTKREIWGVVIIALGLFLGASLYSDAVGIFGRAISGFVFGMFGIAGYAMPVAVVAAGVLCIVFSENEVRTATILLALMAAVSLLSIVHIARRGGSVEGIKTFAYYKDAYELGLTYREGGGVLGALITYPMLLLMGEAGSYILFGACLMVAFLLLTKLSLKAAGQRIGSSIRTGVETANERISERRQQQQMLYTEDITEDVLSGKPLKGSQADMEKTRTNKKKQPK